MTQPRTLFPDQIETQATSLNIFMYYIKPSDGWIVPAPAWPQAYTKRLRNGWTPLPQYGTFTPGKRSTDIRGQPFNAHAELWRVIFQKDGAKAFPVDQVIAYNWHLAPPYREVIFPQMEGVEVPQLDCPECAIPPCHDVTDLATHLRIRHGYARADLKAYGDEIGIRFDRKRTTVRVTRSVAPPPSVAEMTPATLEKGDPCGIDGCPWSPTKGKNYELAMKGHRRMKHQGKTDGTV